MAERCGRLFFVLLVLFPMHMLPISLIIHFLYLSAVVLVDTDFETYIDMIYNWNLVKPWQWYNDLTPSQAEHSLGFTMGYMWTLLAIVQVSILRTLWRERRPSPQLVSLDNRCVCYVRREYMMRRRSSADVADGSYYY